MFGRGRVGTVIVLNRGKAEERLSRDVFTAGLEWVTLRPSLLQRALCMCVRALGQFFHFSEYVCALHVCVRVQEPS